MTTTMWTARESVRRLLFAGTAFTLTACGSGGGSGPAAGSNPGGGNTGGVSVLQPTFASIQTQVFDMLCINCHIGATAPLGLRLDSANSYALLVGVASSQQPGLLRVNPGNPGASYLIQKLEGTAGTGGQMPLGGTPLPQADIAMIRQWITDGALPPAGQAPRDPVRVSSLSPLPGSTVPQLPMSVMAVFDRELDANTVDTNTFRVERSGGDGSFGDGNEVTVMPVAVTVPAANPTTAVFDMNTSPPVEDTYRITLAGSGPSMILDLDANALDGEFSGAFPSGDGTAGGDFTAEFIVQGVQPTLQSIQDHVFTPICAGCHSGPSGGALPAGLDLTGLTASFLNLVGVASTEVPSLDRVEPGDPDASYLIRKLEGTAAVGGQMPLGGSPLDAATIAAVRQWIADGAAM